MLGKSVNADADSSLLYLVAHIAVVFAVYAGISLLLGLASEDKTVLNRLLQRLSTLISHSRIKLVKRLTVRSG